MELKLLESLPVSRQSAETIRQQLFDRVENGEVDAVKLISFKKYVDKIYDGDDKKNNGLNHLIKDKVLSEIENDPARREWYGFEVTVKEAGATYIYDSCNDPELAELLEKKAELDKEIKERQEFLRSLKGGFNIITKDGESVTVYPPAKKSTTSPTFKLK